AATIRSPLAIRAGIAARIGGMRRWYALVLHEDGKAQLVKCLHTMQVLAETDFAWEVDTDYALSLTVEGDRLTGAIGDTITLEATDTDRPFAGGSAGLVVEAGTVVSGPITITPPVR
ncbi:MAG TPA: hypothetical protein VD767_06645, partial [Thermomicrobiales bacterium]|nr:hypothetical protein [Thermomicrobiales bacterium]